jgi:hypothetical protein
MPILRNGKPIRDYACDKRTAVNNNMRPPARIVVYRPRIELPWEVAFDVLWDEKFMEVADFPVVFRDVILQRGGRMCGWGAFRPEHHGWFGKFKVKSCKIEV